MTETELRKPEAATPDLIERLMKMDTPGSPNYFVDRKGKPLVREIISEITALRAKVKAQGEALKPFAKIFKSYDPAHDDAKACVIWIEFGDLRRAAQEAGHE